MSHFTTGHSRSGVSSRMQGAKRSNPAAQLRVMCMLHAAVRQTQRPVVEGGASPNSRHGPGGGRRAAWRWWGSGVTACWQCMQRKSRSAQAAGVCTEASPPPAWS